MIRRHTPDFAVITLLFVLPLILFWQQTIGGRTLLPTENLYQYEPFATYREVVKAPDVPYNALLSDLVLENFQWKSFIRESISNRDVPLWNPHQFSGIPFLAAGQQSTLYPFSVLYYVLPLPAAYGWFTVVQLWLAGAFMYVFLRGIRVGRFGSTLAGVVYQLSAFFVISAVFPMIIASAAWLPLVLLAVELIIQQRPALRGRPATIPWVVLGAVALGCNVLAGHVEITYYVLIIAGYYAAVRLFFQWWAGRQTQTRSLMWIFQRGIWLVGMVVLGLGIGAIQFVPLFELASMNYRDGRATLEQVRGWAHPMRDAVQFLLPNFYGNPSHHSYFDIFTGQTITQFTDAAGHPITTIDWGIKNYVEGALYLGILPLVLVVYGIFNRQDAKFSMEKKPPYKGIFAVLTVVALTFMFGLPTYAILYYGFPGINQLHSPFRWIFGVTVGIAVLAGFGADALANEAKSVRLTRLFGYIGAISGGLILIGLLVTRLLFPTFEPMMQRIVNNLAQADRAFSDARMFYSYQFVNVAMLGLMLLGAGMVFLWAGRNSTPPPTPPHSNREGRKIRLWQIFAVSLVAVDLMAASWSFNPASDPALLDFTPPAIQWLKQQPGEWRYTTIDSTTVDDPTMGERGKIMNANMGWRYGLDDIRGYESIIPKQYVDFMGQLAPQVQLDYNRVAPLYSDKQYAAWGQNFKLADALQSPLLGLLNVRYVMTSKQFSLPVELTTSSNSRTAPKWRLAYEDEAVRIWEHGYEPRAYITQMPVSGEPTLEMNWGPGNAVVIDSDSGREKILTVNINPDTENSWLVLSETYIPGWRAFARPLGGNKDTERPLAAEKVMDNFIGVNVSPDVVQKAFADIHDKLPDAQRMALDNGQLTLRVSYSPPSFQIGLFASFISGILLVFMGGIYLWRLFVSAGGQTEGVQVVARNSLAPIILNLFNRGIDFGFAFIMLRILGPEGSGIYTYAGFIFGWFDIFTNFGLNVFLTREVARDPGKAWRYFYNTSVLRLLLMVVGVVLLLGFLSVRQGLAGSTPLTQEALIAIGLLYIGLLPNSLSTGMSALFYAFQQAEYPAAISTVATICKVIFGLAALVLGYGVIGLAAASIVTNTITLVVMVWVGRGLLRAAEPPPHPASIGGGQRDYKPDRKLIRGMVNEGWPLMLNHFLATIFFQIDVVIIQYFHGDTVVGEYGVAYKWINALNVIPAFFTMALLPVMSRQAHEDKAALKRNYGLAIKLLVSTALPVAVVFTALAFVLTGILGGSQFLPDGAIATQLMIWSIPIGWINSLTQYVLIALDLQRRITRAFFIAVGFNIISNLIFIPIYSYRAAAVTTILSELALLIPFALLLQGAVGRIDWIRLLWKPVVAVGAMAAVVLLMANFSQIVAVIAGVVVYVGVLLALRPLDADEMERLAPILPFKKLTQRRRVENTG